MFLNFKIVIFYCIFRYGSTKSEGNGYSLAALYEYLLEVAKALVGEIFILEHRIVDVVAALVAKLDGGLVQPTLGDLRIGKTVTELIYGRSLEELIRSVFHRVIVEIRQIIQRLIEGDGKTS